MYVDGLSEPEFKTRLDHIISSVYESAKNCGFRSGCIVKEIVYNKLVRDNIPEIIEADGKTCEIEILSDDEYIKMIDAKLDEELAEYHKDQKLEELADLLEVIQAAAIARGYSIEELEALRTEKAEKRGGFEKRIFLKSVK